MRLPRRWRCDGVALALGNSVSVGLSLGFTDADSVLIGSIGLRLADANAVLVGRCVRLHFRDCERCAVAFGDLKGHDNCNTLAFGLGNSVAHRNCKPVSVSNRNAERDAVRISLRFRLAE